MTRDEQKRMILDGVVANDELFVQVYNGMSRSGLYLMSSGFSVLSQAMMPKHSEVNLMVLPNYIAPVPGFKYG